MEPSEIRASDGKHVALHVYRGNIDDSHIVPSYYSLTIDDVVLGERLFAREGVWLNDTLYAVTELLTIDYDEWPITRVSVINPAMRVYSVCQTHNGAWISPIGLEEGKLRVCIDYLNGGDAQWLEDDAEWQTWIPY
jgi:hypothetical protein